MSLPEDPEERIEWIISRGQRLDLLLETSWVHRELARLFANPEKYANGEMYDPSVADDEKLYALFRLGFNSGVEYERQYPTGEQEVWDVRPVTTNGATSVPSTTDT